MLIYDTCFSLSAWLLKEGICFFWQQNTASSSHLMFLCRRCVFSALRPVLLTSCCDDALWACHAVNILTVQKWACVCSAMSVLNSETCFLCSPQRLCQPHAVSLGLCPFLHIFWQPWVLLLFSSFSVFFLIVVYLYNLGSKEKNI